MDVKLPTIMVATMIAAAPGAAQLSQWTQYGALGLLAAFLYLNHINSIKEREQRERLANSERDQRAKDREADRALTERFIASLREAYEFPCRKKDGE